MRRLIGASMLYMVSATGQRIVAAFVTFWLATRLSTIDYGRYGLGLALQQFVTIVALGGIVESVIGRMRALEDGPVRSALFASARRAVLVMAVCILVLLSVGLGLTANKGFEIAEGMSAVAAGTMFGYASMVAALARLEERHSVAIVYTTLPTVISYLAGVVAILLLNTVWSFFLGAALGGALGVVILRYMGDHSSRTPAEAVSATSPCPLLVMSVPYFGATLFGWLSGFGYNFVIDHFFATEEIARFTFALSIASLLLMVASALNQVWSRRFYPIATLEVANRAFHSVLSVAMGILGGAMVLAYPVALHLLGAKLAAYADMQANVAVLVAGYVVLPAWWQCMNHLLSGGHGRVLFRVTAVSGALGIAAGIGLLLLLGSAGIYLSFVLTMVLRASVISLAVRRSVAVSPPVLGISVGLILVAVAFLISHRVGPLFAQIAVYLAASTLFAVITIRDDLRRCAAVW